MAPQQQNQNAKMKALLRTQQPTVPSDPIAHVCAPPTSICCPEAGVCITMNTYTKTSASSGSPVALQYELEDFAQ